MPTMVDPIAPALLLDDPIALARRWDILDELTRRQMVLGASALALTMAGCGGSDDPDAAPPEPATREIFHAFGRSDVPADVQRVVVIDQAVTLEHVVALGVQPAGAPIDGQPPEHVLERLDESVQNTGESVSPNLERIAAVDPDLILGWKLFLTEVKDALAGIATTVATDREGFGAWKADLRFVGDVLNRRARAEEVIAEYEERVADLKERFAPYADRTFAVISLNEDVLRIDGPDKSFPGPILAELGLRTGPREIAGGELNPISGQINFSFEYIPALEAVDGLLIWPQSADAEDEEFISSLEDSPLWTALPAVQEGRLAKVKQDTWLQGSVIAAHLVLDDLERLLPVEPGSTASPTAEPDSTVQPSPSPTATD